MAELSESDKKKILGQNYRTPEQRLNDPAPPETFLGKLWRRGKALISRQR